MQTELDFTTHVIENNPDSESFLNENKNKLSNECEKVYNLLKQGRQLSVKECVVENITQSLPRRVLDLKQAGYEVRDMWVMIDNKRSHKIYFL